MAKSVSLALTIAAEGRDKEYKNWQINQHALDVRAIPGVRFVQRFSLSNMSYGTSPYSYPAICELGTDDSPGMFAEIRQRTRTYLVPRYDARSADRLLLDFRSFPPVINIERATSRRQP